MTEQIRPVPTRRRRWLSALSVRNISVVYLLGCLLVLNAFMVPDTFFTTQSLRSVLVQNAITGLIALAVILPLATGAFDLSIGPVVTLGSMGVAMALVRDGVPALIAVLAVILVAALVGAINSFLVVRLEITPIIATLGVGSVVTGLVILVAGQTVIPVGLDFQKIATTQFLGIAAPVYYLLIAGVVLWYLLEFTPFGRNVYATGGGRDAADLAGVRTGFYMAISLISCSALSGFAGIVITAQVSAGSPNVGSSYLLPAYAAAFLGATQLKQGRFNVWGTVLSVYTIAAGVKGFNLVGAQAWITDVFTGAILVIAVAIPRLDRLGTGRLFRRSHTLPAGDSAPAPEEPVDRSSEQAHAER